MNSQLTDLDRPGMRTRHPELLVHPDDAAAAGIVDGDDHRDHERDGERTRHVPRSATTSPAASSRCRTDGGAPGSGHLTTGRAGLDSAHRMVLQSTVPVRLAPADEPVEPVV